MGSVVAAGKVPRRWELHSALQVGSAGLGSVGLGASLVGAEDGSLLGSAVGVAVGSALGSVLGSGELGAGAAWSR